MMMSEETYYTVLNIKETASSAEIKTAYRNLIKQFHPDANANLPLYLKKAAEDKAKEIIEAYTVLSSPTKRSDYDRQLAEYRRQTMPPAPPGPKSTTPPNASARSFGYCNKCGTSLYANGYCPKCSKFATPAATTPASPPRHQAVRWFGPFIVFAIFRLVAFIATPFPDANTPPSQANTSQFPENNLSPFTNNAAAASPEEYSQYPCDLRDKISQIDGKPCSFSVSLMSSDEASPKTKPVAKTPAGIAVVTGKYGATLYKQCAFLPFEDYSRCSIGHERVAQLKRGDRVRFLSPLTEAQSGADIYKVRTQQGWVGWARAEDLTLK
jgi:curved DNA-binding protein CbpA